VIDKRSVLSQLGWTDELIDAFMGDGADAPLDAVFVDVSVAPTIVSASEMVVDFSAESSDASSLLLVSD
jgi:hypothetical protein